MHLSVNKPHLFAQHAIQETPRIRSVKTVNGDPAVGRQPLVAHSGTGTMSCEAQGARHSAELELATPSSSQTAGVAAGCPPFCKLNLEISDG